MAKLTPRYTKQEFERLVELIFPEERSIGVHLEAMAR